MSYTQDQCQSANLSHKPQYKIEYMLVLLKHLLGLLVSPSMKFHNIDTECEMSCFKAAWVFFLHLIENIFQSVQKYYQMYRSQYTRSSKDNISSL